MTTKRWIPLLALLSAACATEPADDVRTDTTAQSADVRPISLNGAPSYDFQRPDLSIALPKALTEISGLTILSDGNLGAVQDETGIVFVINRESGAIDTRHSFAGAGDYEGIERVEDRLYVLRSDGTLMELALQSNESVEPRTISTSLSAKNDTEGLAYDSSRNRLLIACKENPGADLADGHRAIYAFDLAEKILIPEPAYVIDTDELEDRFKVRGKFKPSALAVHPMDGSIYVLSATSRAVAVLGANGGVVDFLELPGKMFEQPEALAFASDGTLYIASEGDKGPGMLYSFSRMPGGE